MANQPTVDYLHNCLIIDLLDSSLAGFDIGSAPTHGGSKLAYSAGASFREVASLAILDTLFKKCKDDPLDSAKASCQLAFLESNHICGLWEPPESIRPPLVINLGKIGENPDYKGIEAAKRTTFLNDLRSNFQSIVSRPVPESLASLPGFDGSDPWSWHNVFLLGDIGPGAAMEASGGSWFQKYCQSPLTSTSEELIEHYRQSLGDTSMRSDVENLREASYGYLVAPYGRFDSVPKTHQIDRSIEVQPAINMWAQKGIAEICSHYLRASHGVNLSCQPMINAELARRASLDGSLATVDLKEASNRIPWELIKFCCGDHLLLDLIELARVPATLMPYGTVLDLEMCSTMGCGFTFILQTMLFTAAVETVLNMHDFTMHRQPRDTWSKSIPDFVDTFTSAPERYDIFNRKVPVVMPNFSVQAAAFLEVLENVTLPSWAVFGDDIIVPVKCYPDLKYLIEICMGGQVNDSKSHFTGDFRESCGGDFYRGINVRGVYAKSIKTPQDRLSLLNRLISWSGHTRVPLRTLCRALWASIPEKLLVPYNESDIAGLRVPVVRAPRYPKSSAIKDLEASYQITLHPYKCFEDRPKLVTFEGYQLAIWGPGILLSMLKGEVSSTNLSSGLLTERDLRRGDSKVRPNLYNLSVRSDDQSPVGVVWRSTSDWNAGLNNTTKQDLDWSLAQNLY